MSDGVLADPDAHSVSEVLDALMTLDPDAAVRWVDDHPRQGERIDEYVGEVLELLTDAVDMIDPDDLPVDTGDVKTGPEPRLSGNTVTVQGTGWRTPDDVEEPPDSPIGIMAPDPPEECESCGTDLDVSGRGGSTTTISDGGEFERNVYCPTCWGKR